MTPATLTYLRRQLRMSEGQLDRLLRVSAGTVAAAEDAKHPLKPVVAKRLRAIVKAVEDAGHLGEPGPPPNLQEPIGRMIRAARERRGMSLTQAARKAEMVDAAWLAIENHADAMVSTLRRIAFALDVSIASILEEPPIVVFEEVPLAKPFSYGIMPKPLVTEE